MSTRQLVARNPAAMFSYETENWDPPVPFKTVQKQTSPPPLTCDSWSLWPVLSEDGVA